MAQFALTSYERVRRYLAAETGDNITDSVNLRREIQGWIPVVSALVEGYCNRKFYLTTYTEYFDVRTLQTEFFIQASPISSITSVYYSSQGLFTGEESALSDYYIGTGDKSIVLSYPEEEAKRALRIIYIGGFGTSATQSVFTCTITGSFTVGLFISGNTSGAMGIVKAVTATTLTIEVLYGVFVVGETLTEWATESARGASTATAVFTAAVSRAICENYPDLVRGTEMQLRYMYKNKLRFEDTSINKDGQSVRSALQRGNALLQLQPEVQQAIGSYTTVAFI